MVIPLWLVQETDAPRVLLAWLFGTNTVLAVLLQVPASRGSETVNGALRAARISTGFMVLSCFVVMVTHDTIGLDDHPAGVVGHVTVTGAELFQSAGHWGLTSELSEPARRAEYQGADARRRHPRLGVGAGPVHLPRDGVGHDRLAAHRRHRGRGRHRDPPRRARRRALPGDPHRHEAGRPACLNPSS